MIIQGDLSSPTNKVNIYQICGLLPAFSFLGYSLTFDTIDAKPGAFYIYCRDTEDENTSDLVMAFIFLIMFTSYLLSC